jgi:hypothetical protein
MDARTTGAWIVHHANKLSGVVNPLEYESVLTAGKAGLLLSALSGDEQLVVSPTRVDAIRRANGLTRVETPELLKNLSAVGVINVGRGGAVEVLGVSTSVVLEHTTRVYERLGPANKENASLSFAETTSDVPIEHRAAVRRCSDEFRLTAGQAQEFVRECEELGFIDAENLDSDRKLYFNGNIFRRDNVRKVEAILSSLSDEDVRRFHGFDQLLVQQGAATLERAKRELGVQLFEKLNAAGVFDLNEVANDRESVLYVTRPAAFGKFGNPFVDDALDLAKAFVTCLTYGMTRRSSGTGRITMVKRLLRKLIEGYWVGPATAIGQDYQALETKRVVQLRHSHNGQYSMRLLKREIGELAYEVIALGEAAESSLVLPGAAVSSYVGPEAKRWAGRKRQNSESKRATADILTALRTGTR